MVTPSGRELRGQNKMWGKKLTDNYIESRKKYLQKVKSIEAHNKIVSIIKARVLSRDYEYMFGIEKYISKAFWQRDIKYLSQNGRSSIFTSISKD